jgi:4a-hydroxytetrahydrobiopterin dehydratase
MIALVGDPHDLLVQAELEQELGRVRDEAHDAHALTLRRPRAVNPPPLPGSLGAMTLLSDAEIDQRLAAAEGWNREERDSIEREWTFRDFAQAIAFVDRVAELAETANHHPDILLHGWNKVRLTLSTHSQGGLTDADFQLASQIDRAV